MTLRRSARTSSRRAVSACAVAAALGFVPSTASALVPRFVGTPAVDNPEFDGVANTMMYTVTVTVDSVAADADHAAVVGYISADDYTTCTATTGWKWGRAQTFDTADTRTWTLYNFVPGRTYYYKATLGTGATRRSRCGVLETTAAPTPTLPEKLGYLNIDITKAGASHPSELKYAMIETDDCGASGGSLVGATDYLVVVDTEEEAIVWYLDIAATGGLTNGSASGYRYQPGRTPTSGRIVITVSRRYLYEWAFDGSTINSYDFGPSGECDGDPGSAGPCLHHDVYKSDASGRTYALTSVLAPTTAASTVWEANCGVDAPFVDDGYTVLSRNYVAIGENYLMADQGYDPGADEGPHGVSLSTRSNACVGDTWHGTLDGADGMIDWTHSNSIVASRFGASEVVDVSLKEWDQIVRFDATTGDRIWSLSSDDDYSDFDTITRAAGVVGASRFAGQHDVHPISADTLLMLDNNGDAAGARALQLKLDETAGSGLIEKTWAVTNAAGDPVNCGVEGAADFVPGSEHVLVMCKELNIAAELDDPTGASGNPIPLTISLPNGAGDPFCSTGGPASRSAIRGWHRVFPLATVGEF